MLGAVLLQAGTSAADVGVTPAQVQLASDDPAAVLTLTNAGPAAAEVRITAQAWDPAHPGAIDATADVELTPATLIVPAAGTSSVRVSIRGGPRPTERAYRLRIDELDPTGTARSPPRRVTLSVPVFVVPAQINQALEIRHLALRDGRLSFDLANTGNTHLALQRVRVVGRGATGAAVVERAAPGLTLLGGATQTFRVDVPAADIGRVARFELEADADGLQRQASLDVAAAPNGPEPVAAKVARLDPRRPAARQCRVGGASFVTLNVNGTPRGDLMAYVAGDDVMVRPKDLAAAGINASTLPRIRIGDLSHISLRSLPRTSYRLVEGVVELDMDPELLPTTTVSARDAAPANLEHLEARSLYANYAATVTNQGTTSGFTEVGAHLDGAMAYSSLSARTFDAPPVRGLSYIRWDDVKAMRRLQVGDDIAEPGGFGGGLLVGGIHLSRNFSLNPYFVTTPSFDLEGVATVPSTIDVYVNGVKTVSQAVPAGPIRIGDVNAATGAGQTRVVIRDAFGRETTVSETYYRAHDLLAKGLSQYHYSLGFRRERADTASFDYGELVAVGNQRYGLSKHATGLAWAEATPDLGGGGIGVTLGSDYGQGELRAGVSGASGGAGVTAAAAYLFQSQRFDLEASLDLSSRRYATVQLPVTADRAERAVTARGGVHLSDYLDVSASGSASQFRDRGWSTRSGVTATGHSGRVSIAASLDSSWEASGQREVKAFVSVFTSIGTRSSASLGVSRTVGGTDTGTISLSRGVTEGRSVGFRADGVTGSTSSSSGLVDLQWEHGRYTASGDTGASGSHGSLAAAGGLVLIGGGLHATLPVQQSFALIRVPGVPGIRAYIENRELGRTDANGEIFVPSLQPYYGNQLSINPADIPLERTMPVDERRVATPALGGAVVTFAAPILQTVQGRLRVAFGAQPMVPAGGELVVDGVETLWSPVGLDGEFELQLGSGTHAARVVWKGKVCSFELDVPAANLPVQDLGVLRCDADGTTTSEDE